MARNQVTVAASEMHKWYSSVIGRKPNTSVGIVPQPVVLMQNDQQHDHRPDNIEHRPAVFHGGSAPASEECENGLSRFDRATAWPGSCTGGGSSSHNVLSRSLQADRLRGNRLCPCGRKSSERRPTCGEACSTHPTSFANHPGSPAPSQPRPKSAQMGSVVESISRNYRGAGQRQMRDEEVQRSAGDR